MKYEEMSDSELNLAVAKIIYPDDQCLIPYNHRADVQIFHRNNLYTVKDFCNSWADAGPIVEKHRITITSLIDGTAWDALSIMGEVEFRDENPLRAAMIVFLMMKEAE